MSTPASEQIEFTEGWDRPQLYRALAVVGLVVAALFLYLDRPDLPFRKDVGSFTVSCDSLAATGWSNPPYLGDGSAMPITYEVTRGSEPEEGEDEPPFAVEQRITQQCDQARTHRAAVIGLFGFPLAFALALRLGRSDERRRGRPAA